MRERVRPLLAGLLLALVCPSVLAQSGSWQVVAGESASVLTPDLPPGQARNFADFGVADAGAALFGLRLTTPTAAIGYWAFRAGAFTRVTQLNSNAAPGPGRSGAEAAHVFLSVEAGWHSVAADGQRAFAGRAGDPAATLEATHGLWRWDTSRNIEVARGSTDGILGPGLGAGWQFPNVTGFASARMLSGGHLLVQSEVLSPTLGSSRLVVRHVPGQGNLPCLRTTETAAALAPGLSPGDSFTNFSDSLDRFSVTPGGRIRARLPVSGAREGIFDLCAGPPRVLAADDVTGALGPGITTTATFADFSFMAPLPSGETGLVYFAEWQEPATSSRRALFHYDGTRNRGIAYNEASGFFGPNFMGASWRGFMIDSLTVAEDYLAFVAEIDTIDSSPFGLWRLRPGERPEPVALLGFTNSPVAPEAGRSWRSFGAISILRNGDIVLEAVTDPNATRDLWLLRRGRAPQRLLSVGQIIQVPTTQGIVSTAVTSFDVPDGGVKTAGGGDSWAAIDGTLLVQASTSLGTVLLSQRLPVPAPGTLHADGFE